MSIGRLTAAEGNGIPMGKEKARLGRGLASLVAQLSEPPGEHGASPAATATQSESSGPALEPTHLGIRLPGQAARLVPVADVDPNPYQPRTQSDPAALLEMVESVRQYGIVQPIVVRPHGHRYQLLAGHRRLEAARQAELKTIPAVVREADEQQMLEIALVENIHREDLNPVDRAVAYRQYRDAFGLSPEQIAERLGQDRSTVANYLRLLALPEKVLAFLRAGKLGMGHARALAGLDDPELQRTLADKVVKEGLSVRQAEKLAARGRVAPVPAPPRPPHIHDLEQQMTRALGTRVLIKTGRKKGTGKITIEFHSLDDFDRILDKICGADREPL